MYTPGFFSCEELKIKTESLITVRALGNKPEVWTNGFSVCSFDHLKPNNPGKKLTDYIKAQTYACGERYGIMPLRTSARYKAEHNNAQVALDVKREILRGEWLKGVNDKTQHKLTLEDLRIQFFAKKPRYTTKMVLKRLEIWKKIKNLIISTTQDSCKYYLLSANNHTEMEANILTAAGCDFVLICGKITHDDPKTKFLHPFTDLDILRIRKRYFNYVFKRILAYLVPEDLTGDASLHVQISNIQECIEHIPLISYMDPFEDVIEFLTKFIGKSQKFKTVDSDFPNHYEPDLLKTLFYETETEFLKDNAAKAALYDCFKEDLSLDEILKLLTLIKILTGKIGKQGYQLLENKIDELFQKKDDIESSLGRLHGQRVSITSNQIVDDRAKLKAELNRVFCYITEEVEELSTCSPSRSEKGSEKSTPSKSSSVSKKHEELKLAEELKQSTERYFVNNILNKISRKSKKMFKELMNYATNAAKAKTGVPQIEAMDSRVMVSPQPKRNIAIKKLFRSTAGIKMQMPNINPEASFTHQLGTFHIASGCALNTVLSIDNLRNFNNEKFAQQYDQLVDAVAQGNPIASTNMGLYFLYGISLNNRDLNYAVRCFQYAASKGVTEAFYMSGYVYHYEIKDHYVAYLFFQSGSKKNHAPSETMLGHYYRNGIYVDVDLRKAAEHFKKSLNLDNIQIPDLNKSEDPNILDKYKKLQITISNDSKMLLDSDTQHDRLTTEKKFEFESLEKHKEPIEADHENSLLAVFKDIGHAESAKTTPNSIANSQLTDIQEELEEIVEELDELETIDALKGYYECMGILSKSSILEEEIKTIRERIQSPKSKVPVKQISSQSLGTQSFDADFDIVLGISSSTQEILTFDKALKIEEQEFKRWQSSIDASQEAALNAGLIACAHLYIKHQNNTLSQSDIATLGKMAFDNLNRVINNKLLSVSPTIKACYGWLYKHGFGLNQKEPYVAYLIFKDCAEQHDALACYELALMNQEGAICTQDLKQAIRYFEEAKRLNFKYANLEKLIDNCRELLKEYEAQARQEKLEKFSSKIEELRKSKKCLEEEIKLAEEKRSEFLSKPKPEFDSRNSEDIYNGYLQINNETVNKLRIQIEEVESKIKYHTEKKDRFLARLHSMSLNASSLSESTFESFSSGIIEPNDEYAIEECLEDIRQQRTPQTVLRKIATATLPDLTPPSAIRTVASSSISVTSRKLTLPEPAAEGGASSSFISDTLSIQSNLGIEFASASSNLSRPHLDDDGWDSTSPTILISYYTPDPITADSIGSDPMGEFSIPQTGSARIRKGAGSGFSFRRGPGSST